MTRRSITNDRYTAEDTKKKGTTRKSAASARPKRGVAESVNVVSNKKTKEEVKLEQRRRNEEARRVDAAMQVKYGQNTNAKIKKLRILWWVCLALAVVCTVVTWLIRESFDEWVSYVAMGGAYVFIVSALVIDFVFIRRERKRLAREIEKSKKKGGMNKEYKEEQRRIRALMKDEEKQAREKAAEQALNPQKNPALSMMENVFKKNKTRQQDKENESDMQASTNKEDKLSAQKPVSKEGSSGALPSAE